MAGDAVQARRQVGSAFKPFVYGTALEQGWTPSDTLLDAPTGFMGGDGKLSYWPQNYYHKHYGIVTLRRALEQSINVPAVKLWDLVTGKRVIDFAQRFGIRAGTPQFLRAAPGEIVHRVAVRLDGGEHRPPPLCRRMTVLPPGDLDARRVE